jgi:DNA-binding MarR family transcriptional regulator
MTPVVARTRHPHGAGTGRTAARVADPVLEFIRRMWAVDHELQRVSKRMVSRIGLTAPQRLAVRFIGRHAGLTLGNLAELLHLHAGTVTGIVRRLEQLGLVVQTRSLEDTRRRHLMLTPKGRRIDRLRKGTVEAAVRRTAAGASADQLAAAAHVLDLLARNLAAE